MKAVVKAYIFTARPSKLGRFTMKVRRLVFKEDF